MRTGPEGNLRATREYQHTNRRVNKITRRHRFTSWPLLVAAHFEVTFEEKSPFAC